MPSLTPTILYILFVGVSYVLVLNIKPAIGSRNDPHVIKSRMLRVSVLTSAHLLAVPTVYESLYNIDTSITVFKMLGIKSLADGKTWYEIICTLKLFILLFCAPVVDLVFESYFLQSSFSIDLESLRDLVVAPLTEEIIYTSLATGSLLTFEISARNNNITERFINSGGEILQIAGYENNSNILKRLYVTLTQVLFEMLKYFNLSAPEVEKFEVPLLSYSPTIFHNDSKVSDYLIYSPLLFGFAHLNHGIDMYFKGVSIMQIIVICVFQCLYTTLFGYLTNMIFVNTGNIWCCIVAHSFCNFLGFPKITVEGSIPYRLLYWGLLIFGIYSFYGLFDDLTYGSTL